MEEENKTSEPSDNTKAGGDESASPPKKPRGNPNFKKGVRNSYYTDKPKTNMAEEGTTKPEDTTQNTNPDVKKDIPADIFSDEIPQAEIIPLAGEMNTKDYAGIKDGPKTSSDGGSNKPPVTPTDGTTATPDPNNGPTPDPSTTAAAIGTKTPEEIRTEAEQMVAMMLRGYEKMHGLGRWAGKVDQNELMNQHLSGKIDLNLLLPLGKKGPVPVQQFFTDYNESIDENIVVTNKFKEEITPPLVRIAIKRGWILGDELFVAMLLSEDLATKVSMLVGLKKSANLVLEACQGIMKKQNETTQKQEVKKEAPVEQATQMNEDQMWEQANDAEQAASEGAQ